MKSLRDILLEGYNEDPRVLQQMDISGKIYT